MEYRRFDNTYVVRLDPGEEILEQIKVFAEKEGVKLASVQAIGAVNEFTVGAFDTAAKQYHSNEFRGAAWHRQHDGRQVLCAPAHDGGGRDRPRRGRAPQPRGHQRDLRDDRDADPRHGRPRA